MALAKAKYDRRTDRQISDPYVVLCFTGATVNVVKLKGVVITFNETRFSQKWKT